ncbi:MAG: hypothetical protein CVV31_09245 [Methanomicrobiales archaeon HGW-Methanomicrobiales-2]|nr:MAG: hypothetical protein CVV31_09245 [Methanomicrobiales archaeon HGW-Methanomicrobiales-2]
MSLLISDLVIRYAAQGHQQVLDAERRIRGAISETARTAAKETGITKQWMERNKTALAAIGVAAGGAMAAIISQTPDLVAGLSETQLYFSMFAQELGATWSPALDAFNGLLEDALGWFESLPTPIKNAIGGIAGIGLGLLVAIPAIALFVWSLSTIGVALADITIGPFVGAMGLLTLGLAVVAGALLGGLITWGLWKTGIIQAIEDAGAWFGWFAQNAITVLGNLKDNLVEWGSLVAASAGLWGAQFALNWIDGITKNIPFLGDALAPKIDSLRTALDAAGTDLQARWAEWNTSGGFQDGLMEGMIVSQPTPNRTVSDTIGGFDSWLFGSAGSGSSEQADRLSEMYPGLPEFTMPPGYDDATQKLLDLQQRAEDLDATAAITSSNVSASMSGMAGNTSTSSQAMTATTGAATTSIATSFDTLVARSPKWGSDLMGHFVVGLNGQYPALLSAVARIRSMIESALSFDIAANDRAAQRWGSDFVQMFGAGMQQATPAMAIPAPAPVATGTGGGGGGATYYITVPVDVQVNGAEAKTFDERKIAVMVKNEIAGALKGRGR